MTTGGTEILVVLAIAVMLFGPKKLPELARTLGQAMGEYHRAQREFETEMRKTTTAIDREVSSVTRAEPKAAASRPPLQKQAGAAQRPSTQSAPSKTGQESKEVRQIAENLGIKTAGKTEAELLKEISLKTKKPENNKV